MTNAPNRPRAGSGGAPSSLDATLVRFAVVGAITTSLDLALFAGLTHGGSAAPVAANLASYSCGILTSFALNHWWTFGSGARGRSVPTTLIRFLMSNLAGLGLSTLLVGTLALHLPPALAKATSVPVVFVWNYAVARYLVFR